MKKSIDEALRPIRHQLDLLDEQIHALISERARLALQIAQIKRENGDEALYYRPEHESQILRRLKERNKGPLADEDIIQLFQSIMALCRTIQQPIHVGYLGPEGSFSQNAVLKHFGHSIQQAPLNSIKDVFAGVERKELDYGVVPLENTTGGMVMLSLGELLKTELTICGEIILPIHQNLMCKAEQDEKITKIFSHQQSFLQCNDFLDKYYPDVERVAVNSNAAAAKLASIEPNSAAIASEEAAILYNLHIVKDKIEDNPNNMTRFLVLGYQQTTMSEHDKTTLLLSLEHQPGSLWQILQPFAANKVNISMIQSYPYPHQNWRHVFFIDIVGHRDSPAVKKALKKVLNFSVMLKILGSYPSTI